MGSMASLVYAGPRRVEWREAPAPVLTGGTDALVRPTASAFCDLDRRIARGATPFEAPFPLGHEATGEIVEVGDEAARAGLRPGQRVIVPFYLSCGTCERCRAGRRLNCTTTPRLATHGIPIGGRWGGLFDDLVRVPFAASSLIPVPDEVPAHWAASVGDNLTDAYVGIGPALRERPDAPVLILGGTPSLSLLITMFAVALGTGPVTFADPDPGRCAAARALGAGVIEGPLPDRVEGEYEIVVDAHGDPERGPAVAARSVAPGGRCHFRCVYFPDVVIPYFELSEKGIRIDVGLPQVHTHAPEVLRLLAERRVPIDRVLRPALPYDRAADAVLERLVGKPVFVRDAGAS